MAKRNFLVTGAAMAAVVVMTSAHAKPPPPPAEVASRWKSYFADSSYSYYRDPAIIRDGTNVSLWKVSVPTPSMSKLGVPISYERVTYDCVGKRKKIMEMKRFKADGSILRPPEKDVKLDSWFPTLSASDTLLQGEVCSST